MSTRPQFISLDRASLDPVEDLAIARVSTLRQAIHRQHALMSGWGGAPQARECFVIAENGASATWTMSYCAPPGVTEVDVSALIYGLGSVRIESSADAVGTTFRSTSQTDNAIEGAAWYHTNGALDSDEGAESGRALTVRAAVAWTWATIDVTIYMDAASTADLFLFGLVFRPIHMPR